MTTLSLIVSTIVAMLVHELGHLAAAKAFGVSASEISLGLGPKICGVRIGAVHYNLRLLPLGSFVRLGAGELRNKSMSQQMFVHLAGVIVNLALAVAAYGTVFGWVNLLLAAANLLPLYQHDGWKCGVVLMRALLRRRSRPVEWTFTFSGGVVSLALVKIILRLIF